MRLAVLCAGLAGAVLPARAASDLAAAQAGNAEAQYGMAAAYFQGTDGYERDIAQALEWLQRAADQGYMPAAYRLGEIYFHGYGGVPRDLVKAAAAFRRPAVADYEEAKVYLGYLYFIGEGGLARDEERGIVLLREAAARGQQAAWKLLWEAYADGKLAPIHEDELVAMIEAGAAAGDPRAQETLGLRLLLGPEAQRDLPQARALLSALAERGSVLAATAMADDIGALLDGPAADRLSDRERRDLDARFKRMVHLIAVHGGKQGRDAFIRVLTRLTPLAQHAPRDAGGSIVVSDDLVAALAWGRIHREDQDPQPEVLRWVREGEAWIADYPRIRDRVDTRERTLRAELERAGAAGRAS